MAFPNTPKPVPGMTGGVARPGPARTNPTVPPKPPMTGGPTGGFMPPVRPKAGGTAAPNGGKPPMTGGPAGGVVGPNRGRQLPPKAAPKAGAASTTKKVKSFMKKYGQA